jgi:hypothetical protein
LIEGTCADKAVRVHADIIHKIVSDIKAQKYRAFVHGCRVEALSYQYYNTLDQINQDRNENYLKKTLFSWKFVIGVDFYQYF